MKLAVWLCCFLSLGFQATAQKPGPPSKWDNHPIDSRKAQRQTPNVQLGLHWTISDVQQFVEANNPHFAPGWSEARILHQQGTAVGKHVQYEQWVNLHRVYRSSGKVNLTMTGRIYSHYVNTVSASNRPASTFPEKTLVTAYLHQQRITPDSVAAEHIYFPENNQLTPALLVTYSAGLVHREVVLDAMGIEIYGRNLLSNAAQEKDTTVTVRVFAPDPLTSSQSFYGCPYCDNDPSLDATNAALEAEQIDVQVAAQFDSISGNFTLENDICKVVDQQVPLNGVPSETSPQFLYTRDQPGFEASMALYYLTLFRTYLNSIDDSIPPFQVSVDPHSGNADNSSAGGTIMNLGIGGIDDGEDADVIIHEYGHNVSSFIASPNAGTERNALDEGIGDYFAASYSKSASSFQWGKVYTWDGNNGNWQGRTVVTVAEYPIDLVGQMHTDGQMWAATLMQIETDLGRDLTHQLLLCSMRNWEANMSMADAAQEFLMCDSLINGGANYALVCNWFQLRGLVDACIVGTEDVAHPKPMVQVLNSEGFVHGQSLSIAVNDHQRAEYSIVDATGCVVMIGKAPGSQTTALDLQHLPAGLYLLNWSCGSTSGTQKLVRE